MGGYETRQDAHGKLAAMLLQQIANDDATLLPSILSDHPHGPREGLFNNRDTKLLIEVRCLDFTQRQ